ncbi:hypothetical protein ABEB36_006788 [Hypothenemus hampei]|uniref:L-dopachrome isomerase n=1 Tax=Hypothenemus hampei TaxID=57062 RepID=A0ABD1EVP5_HYPHA
MPYLRLETNVPQEKIPASFPSELCEIVSKSLGKPLSYCAATVVGGVSMAFGGTNEPTAQATLMSIGALGVAENKKHAKAIFEAVEKTLGIPPTRYLFYRMSGDSTAKG